MIDVSDVLARLGDQSLTWDEEVAVEIADDLARSVGGVVDWDDEAGEEWLSVLLRDARVAMVSTTLRLIVAVERMSGEVQVVARGKRRSLFRRLTLRSCNARSRCLGGRSARRTGSENWDLESSRRTICGSPRCELCQHPKPMLLRR